MKPIVKIRDAMMIRGKLMATLAEMDTKRGWPEGSEITTSTVINVEGNKYETLNTIYEVEGNVWYPKNQGK